MICDRPGEFFTWAEMTTTSRPENNTPGEAEQAAIVALCAAILDPLRRALGKPIRISSGYRSPAVNAAVGGSKTSQHMRGEAADLSVLGMQPEDIVTTLVRAGLPFDQAIVERLRGAAWVHVSYALGRPGRRQTLAITEAGARPWSVPNG
jgi:hypothetical protein